MYLRNHYSNSSLILELSVKFASQICHENIKKPLDGAYLADFVIDIKAWRQPLSYIVKLHSVAFMHRSL